MPPALEAIHSPSLLDLLRAANGVTAGRKTAAHLVAVHRGRDHRAHYGFLASNSIPVFSFAPDALKVLDD